MRTSPGCDVPWRDEVLTRCSGSQHPSSLPVKGAGRAQVSTPPAPWCHDLVATGVIRHQKLGLILVVWTCITLTRGSLMMMMMMIMKIDFTHVIVKTRIMNI